jgi:hypothetical protein
MVETLEVFDFQLTDEDIARITTLKAAASSFFSHRDPAMVKWMSERRLDLRRLRSATSSASWARAARPSATTGSSRRSSVGTSIS